VEKHHAVLSAFAGVNEALIGLLRDLGPDEWTARTQFPNWTVKDIVAHLLDTSLRRLSGQRDGHRVPPHRPVHTPADLVGHLTYLADRWAEAFSVVSPCLLIDLVGRYQDELLGFLTTLDPWAPAPHPVSWAGDTESTNGFDIAREYTERWHHQMQIREALGRPPLLGRDLAFPVFDTFFRALPYHYRGFHRPTGFCLEVAIEGEGGGSWFLLWDEAPRLVEAGEHVDARVSLDPATAWKVFTRFNHALYQPKVEVAGDSALGEHLLNLVCLMV